MLCLQQEPVGIDVNVIQTSAIRKRKFLFLAWYLKFPYKSRAIPSPLPRHIPINASDNSSSTPHEGFSLSANF